MKDLTHLHLHLAIYKSESELFMKNRGMKEWHMMYVIIEDMASKKIITSQFII